MKILKITITILLILGLGNSCTEGWEELNTSPNNPSEVPPQNILSYVESAMCGTLFGIGFDFQSTGSYANHFSKIQYIDECRYEERDGTFNNNWANIMAYVVDVNDIILLSQSSENTNLEAVGKTLKAYMFHVMTDTWGAIPFIEGAGGMEGTLQPNYDSQQNVYSNLLAMLEEANTLLSSGTGYIGDADLIYGGDADLWQKFANSLHLRVAIRMSDVDPTTAGSEISKILSSPGTYPIFTSNDDNALLKWNTSSNYEPWYNNSLGRDDHAICSKIVDDMLHLNDPRLPEYAHPATSDGLYRGLVAGIAEADEGFAIASISRVGTRYRDTPDGYSYIMRYSEVEYIKAEAYLSGFATGDAQAAYEAGITASLEEHDVIALDIASYITDLNVAWDGAGDFGYSNLEKIYYQKWLALFKQGHEAWAETRRTDIPLLAAAPGSPYTGHIRPPFRWPYPVAEYTYNETIVEMFDDDIVDKFWGEQMWWDTRTGVN